jgi:nitronate monooxygenase
VSNAGGLGSLGCAAMPPEAVVAAISRLRVLTSGPVNVNFFCHNAPVANLEREAAWRARLASYYRELGVSFDAATSSVGLAPFGPEMCEVIEQARPEIASFHFGLPELSLLRRVKLAGCRVMSSATTVAEACWLEANGVDAVIAQGNEAGGHRATFLDMEAAQLSMAALLPAVVDAVRVPVIAAGGIGDGRGIAAGFALGAAGVQVGTAFLLCPEAATSPLYRKALESAGSTVVTKVFTGRPARALANRLTREVESFSGVPAFPLAMPVLAPLRAEAERQGRTEFSAFWAGETASLARNMPARAMTQLLVEGGLRQMNGCASAARPLKP